VTDTGRGSPIAPGGEVLATVDGLTIDQQTVDAWILGAAARNGHLEPTPETHATAINALVYEHLLRDACAEVCGSGPPSPSRCACDPDAIEKTVTDALLIHEPTEAEIAAEYELQKPAWTSDSPWVALSVIAIPWLEPIGVPACDAVMAQAWRCDGRGLSNPSGKVAIARELRRLAAESDRGFSMTAHCKQIRAEFLAETRDVDCDWSNKAPIGNASKRVAHGRIPAARAKLYGATAEAAGMHEWRREMGYDPEWVYAERSILSIDAVPLALRSVVEQAKLGEPSSPVEHNGAYWMAIVYERWPAGALPLDARRAEITVAARERIEERAEHVLPVRVREGHDIVLHRYEVEAKRLLGRSTETSNYFGDSTEGNAVAEVFATFRAE
jgi:hypothetical protein